MTVTAAAPAPTATTPRELRRVAVSAAVGTTVEFYDFFLFGTAAALVFGTVFFPALGPAGGAVAGMGAFAAAFLARPLGSVVFGHLGDRLGRRRTLVWTLLLMGAATVGVGLLPGADVLGPAAPILLVVLRLVQGLAVGGEWGGAALLVAEHAPREKRGHYGLYPQLGTGIGFALSSATFLVCGLTMGVEAFLAWGWRVPFLLSAVLVGVGLYVRLRVAETPVFREAEARRERSSAPLRDVLAGDARAVLLAAGAFAPVVALGYLGTVYLTGHATAVVGLDRRLVLAAGVVGGLLLAAATVLAARAADRFGRRRTVLAGNLATALCLPAVLPLVDSGTPVLFGAALALVLGLSAVGLGPMASYLPELFPTRYRCTGAGLAFNLAAALGGALPTVLAGVLQATWGSAAVGLLYAVLGLAGAACLRGLPETRGTSLRAAG